MNKHRHTGTQASLLLRGKERIQNCSTLPDKPRSTIIKRMKKHGLKRRSYAEDGQKLRYANIGIILNNINEIVRDRTLF